MFAELAKGKRTSGARTSAHHTLHLLTSFGSSIRTLPSALRQEWDSLKVTESTEALPLELTKQRRGGPRGPSDTSYPTATTLAQHTPGLRYNLAQWVPPKIQGRKMELLYSTDCDGRGLDVLFDSCSFTSCGPTVTLVEVLETGSILGLYTSGPWRSVRKVYGDGTCFVCTFEPPRVFKWAPKLSGSSSEDEDRGRPPELGEM